MVSHYKHRQGATSPIVIVLLAAILLAFISLILVIAWPQRTETPKPGGHTGKKTIEAGESVERGGFSPPAKVAPVGNPKRIKEVLQAGKTYRTTMKLGFDARVEDKDWGLKQVINLAYVVELQMTRKIESNDGRRIEELRTFNTARATKLLSEVEDLAIDLGMPGILILGAIDLIQPGTSTAIVSAQPLIESVLKVGVQAEMNANASKAFAHVDSLSGKTVRIAFLDDGSGVESLMPIGCTLNADEVDFIKDTAVLSDCYFLPNVESKPDDTWTVPGNQLIGYLDPSLRGVPSGEIVVVRKVDENRNGKQIAELAIEKGLVELNASDSSTRRIGSFVPRGKLEYNITDGFIQNGDLHGAMRIEEVSQDHLLFEANFRTEPKLDIQYHCEMLP